jgi:hypothetical protein
MKLPERLRAVLTYRSSIVPTILVAIAASFGVYFTTTFISPETQVIAPAYFVIAIILGLIAATLLFALVARLLKLENRSYTKAFRLAVGIVAIDAIATFLYILLRNMHKVFAAMCVIFAAVLFWYMVKKVHGLTHGKVFRFAIYMFLVLGAGAFVVGLIGSLFLNVAAK